MKKEYMKPFFAVESFQLNAAVAASCSSQGKVAIQFGETDCTAMEEADGQSYFGNGICATDVTSPNEDENGAFCYQGVIDPYSLFISS